MTADPLRENLGARFTQHYLFTLPLAVRVDGIAFVKPLAHLCDLEKVAVVRFRLHVKYARFLWASHPELLLSPGGLNDFLG